MQVASPQTPQKPSARPRFLRDPSFLKLPEGRALSGVMCVDVGPDGHIWVAHCHQLIERSAFLPQDRESLLPEVVEFDADGNFIQAWGGPSHLPPLDGKPQWPRLIETIKVDAEGAIWIFGSNRPYDHAVLRFSRAGELLLRLGRYDERGDDESRDRLACPTGVHLDVASREAFIADGYVNHRVVSFNVDTGEFIRAWGAYGKPLPTGEGPATFNLVHAIIQGPEGHLYVCDRSNNRIQIFDAVGTPQAAFVREFEVTPPGLSAADVSELVFSPEGEHYYAIDNGRTCIWIGCVKTGEVLGSFAERQDTLPGLYAIHRIACDAEGNVLVARVAAGFERHVLQS